MKSQDLTVISVCVGVIGVVKPRAVMSCTVQWVISVRSKFLQHSQKNLQQNNCYCKICKSQCM